MLGDNEIQLRADEVCAELTKRLRLRSAPNLQRAVTRAGRRLPKRVRQQALALSDAALLASHPKLRHMVDARKVDRAENDVRMHLRKIDPKKAFVDNILGVLGSIAFNLLLIAAAFVVWMYVTGRI